MKRTMQYIIAMAAVLWMALPQVKAQGLEEDFDPGVMYIMRNEGLHIPYEEGNEWEITFTALDTLGNEYYSPVGMEIKGGLNDDSTYVVMQTVDSILMYQPEPLMQPDVFVITEEYFPYIAQVDSNTTIHFYGDIALPLPIVGQKVVCNIFKEPLRVGFMGTVLQIETKGTEVVMVCDPKVERLKDFYQQVIYSGGGGRTTEAEEYAREISKAQRIRRGVIVEPLRAPAEIDDPDISFSDELFVNFKKELIKDHLTVGLNLSGPVSFKAVVNVFVSGEEKRGLNMSFEVAPKGNVEIKAEAKTDIPIPGVGWKLENDAPFNTEMKGALGLYVHAEGSVTVNLGGVGLSAKAHMSYLENVETGEYEFERSGTTTEFNLEDISVTLAAVAALRAGIEAEVELCGCANSAFSLYVNIPEISGQIKMTFTDWGSGDEPTPEDLLKAYKSFGDDNYAKIAVGLRGGFEAKVGNDYVEGGVKTTLESDFWSAQANFAPELDKSDSKFGKYTFLEETIGVDRPTQISIDSYLLSLALADIYVWAYDTESKNWYTKKKFGKVGILGSFNITDNINLKMGRTYDLYPVYDISLCNDDISDVVFAQNIYVPYVIKMHEVNVNDFETLTFEATPCAQAIEAANNAVNATWGFEYKQAAEKEWTQVETELVGGKLSAKVPVPETTPLKYSARAFLKLDDKYSYSSSKDFELPDQYAPMIGDVVNIKYSSATFTAELSSTLLESNVYIVGFEYENIVTKEKKTIENSSGGTIGLFELTAENLEPSTTYTVRAYSKLEGTNFYHYSTETKTFTTPAPIYDLKAEKGIDMETGIYAELTATVLKSIYDNCSDLKFHVAESESKLGQTEMCGIDKEKAIVIDDEVLITYRVEGLDPKKKYYYIVMGTYVDNEVGVSIPLESVTEQFSTDDVYDITLGSATLESMRAKLKGTISEYFLYEIANGLAYTTKFYYGTSQSNVKNRTSDKQAVSISSKDIQTTLTGLEPETKYYYMLAVESDFDEDEVYTSEIKSFTTPAIFQIETHDAVVEDAMVTLKATISDAALAEMGSENYNTIYAAFDLVVDEHKSELTKGAASEHVHRITDITSKGTSLTVDVYLEPGTTYHFRALIYVDGKEYYGSTKSFTTLEYDGGLIPLVRKYRPDASAPWVPIIVKPEEKHLATPLKELIKE